MGYGDFKLLAAMGAWFGWQTMPMLVLISSIVGIVLGGSVPADSTQPGTDSVRTVPRDRRLGDAARA